MSKLIHAIAVLCLVGLTTGCLAVKRHHVFDVGAKNIGAARLSNVSIEFEGFMDSMGFLGPGGGGKRYSLFEGRWPATATAKWRFDDDRPYMPDHVAEVLIPPRPTLASQEKLELWFDLDGERVTVRVEKVDLTWINEHMKKQDRERGRSD